MKTNFSKFDNNAGTIELAKEELLKVNGGGFAYDFGFFLRESVVYLINGGGMPGTSAAITDFSLNYKPAH